MLTVMLLVLSSALAQSDWSDFKAANRKAYNGEEDARRKAVWQSNIDEINAHNDRARQGLETYTKAVNKYSDMTFEEFSQIYLSARPEKNLTNVPGARERGFAAKATVSIPASLDLRNTGYVGAIKNQGSCGYFFLLPSYSI